MVEGALRADLVSAGSHRGAPCGLSARSGADHGEAQDLRAAGRQAGTMTRKYSSPSTATGIPKTADCALVVCNSGISARKTEGAREDTRAAAGKEADREVRLEPVQGLVEAAVPREDDDSLDAVAASPGHEVRRMARAIGEEEVELGDSLQLRAHLTEPLLAHAGRERIDDECESHRVA